MTTTRADIEELGVGPSGSTPKLQLPYPTPDDTVDVPRDVRALADALDPRLPASGASGVLNARAVLDVGMPGQIRAGRQLTAADFTALGLSAPIGLWNLSDLTDVSGNGRNLTNKGAVPFGVGINGAAATAAVFAGSTGQALYIADTGAADPFRIRTGSWGCWFRTAKRGVVQTTVSKLSAAASAYTMAVHSSNALLVYVHDGTSGFSLIGTSDVSDDRWHFGVATADGSALRLYVDGMLEATAAFGALNSAAAPLNIGAEKADAAVAAANPHYGRVDEAFVTADVLSDDQVRVLYCAKLAHGYALTPTRATLNVRRRRRGGAFAVADFPTQPLRLYNFTNQGVNDEGSNGVTLTQGAAYYGPGADGVANGSRGYNGTGSDSATDAGLPAGTAARSYGCWFKTATATGATAFGWGTTGTGDARLVFTPTAVQTYSGADLITGPFATDGQWHQAIVVEDNAAGDGLRRKFYLDGRLVGGSTVLNAIVLAGANAFRVGAAPNGAAPFTGQVDGAFVCGYALTFEQVAALYAKGSQALAPSPKSEGDHVESFDATSVYATFDALDSTAQVDMGVAA